MTSEEFDRLMFVVQMIPGVTKHGEQLRYEGKFRGMWLVYSDGSIWIMSKSRYAGIPPSTELLPYDIALECILETIKYCNGEPYEQRTK